MVIRGAKHPGEFGQQPPLDRLLDLYGGVVHNSHRSHVVSAATRASPSLQAAQRADGSPQRLRHNQRRWHNDGEFRHVLSAAAVGGVTRAAAVRDKYGRLSAHLSTRPEQTLQVAAAPLEIRGSSGLIALAGPANLAGGGAAAAADDPWRWRPGPGRCCS